MERQASYRMEEDEIDLKELVATILKHKVLLGKFVAIMTFLTLIYILSIPNSYQSSTKLVPQVQQKSSFGNLGALASMAGVNIGSGADEMDPSVAMQTLLEDYAFQKHLINTYHLSDKLKFKKENLVFALGFSTIYSLTHFGNDSEPANDAEKEALIFDTANALKQIISISSDKKSGVITLSAETQDRFLSKELVDIYLKELTEKLRTIEMKNVQSQIDYYKNELDAADDISIKDQLSQLISGLVQKKVLALSNEYYNVNRFTAPEVPYIRDKSKPKRSLILVVSFITSIIVGVFIIFFLEFLKKEPKLK